jgi:hypothetical protein
MTGRRTGLIAGCALAIGLAVGTIGSAAAAGPTTTRSHHSMMGGSFAPGSTFGPGMMGGSGYQGMMGGSGMMGNLSDTDRQKLLQQCDQIHDAMHSALEASPSPTPKS